MSYYFSKKVSVSFDEAVEKVRDGLAKEGFGILTDIDVKETLKKKLDVDLEAEKVIVRQGKGAKDRVVMLPSSLKPLLEKWFRYNKESEFVICNEYGRQYLTNLLSRRFKEYLEKAKDGDIEGHISTEVEKVLGQIDE